MLDVDVLSTAAALVVAVTADFLREPCPPKSR